MSRLESKHGVRAGQCTEEVLIPVRIEQGRTGVADRCDGIQSGRSGEHQAGMAA
jgi:hypothetical protein